MREFFLFLMLFLVFRLYSQPIPQRPRLIVGIIIEGLNYELLTRYWDKFSDNGIKKLIRGGKYYLNAYYNYSNVNSASGYTIISTGSYPYINGIISKVWYDRLLGREVNCVNDDNYTTIGSDNVQCGVSPKKILVPSWSDYLRVSNYNRSKVISISLDSYAAVLLGGKKPTAVYWFDVFTGKWITSNYYLDSLPQWVIDFNAKGVPEIYLQNRWITSLPISEYTESLPDANSFEKGIKGQTTFPYDMSRLYSSGEDFSILKYTPFANTLTKDFAINAIVSEQLGKDNYTDYLIVSFEATQYIAQQFGSKSIELEDAYIKLDKDIAHLLQVLERNVGSGSFLIFLTSSNGTCDDPRWLKTIGYQVNYFTSTRVMVLLNSYLRSIYGLKNWVEYVSGNSIYLNTKEIDKQKIAYDEIEERVTNFIVQFSSVSLAIPVIDIRKFINNSLIYNRLSNSYCPSRSGEIMFLLNDYTWYKEEENSINYRCISPYSFNVHIPIIFYGWKVSPERVYRRVDVADIVSTICFILGIESPLNQSYGPLFYVDSF